MSGKRNWGDNMTHRNDGKFPPSVDDGYKVHKIPSKTWKKKYECKRNKGDHTFVISLIKYADWKQEKDGTWVKPQVWWQTGRGVRERELPYWVQWNCSACNKQEHEYYKREKKFDKFRETINQHANW